MSVQLNNRVGPPMITEPRKKLKPLWRCLAALVGVLLLCMLALAQGVEWAIRGKYYPDHAWPGLTLTNGFWLLSGLYCVFVAVLGKWKVRQ